MLDFTLWTSDIMTLFLMRACITASLVQLDCASGYLVYLEWVFCLPKMGILSTSKGHLVILECASRNM